MRFNPLNYPLALGDPQYLSDVSAWVGHVPFAWALLEMIRPRTLVELGTLKGDSYCAFCQGVAALKLETRCTAIDTWRGDEHTGGYPGQVLDELRRYHDPLYGSFSTLLQSDFDSAAARFDDGDIDLLHVDGLHTYEAVRHDYETWRAKLSKRGVVLFHDAAVRKRDFGVWRLWEELAPHYPSFLFHHENGLGVLAVGNDVPPPLAEFIEQANRQPDLVRGYFAALGGRITLGKVVLVWSAVMDQAAQEVERWRRERGLPPPNVGAGTTIRQKATRLMQDVTQLIEAAQSARR